MYDGSIGEQAKDDKRRSGKTVNRRLRRDVSKAKFVDHLSAGNLPRRITVSRVRPRTAEVCREQARGYARRSHTNEHALARSVSQIEQRQVVPERSREYGNLHDLRAGATHRAHARGKVTRHAIEVVHRQDDAFAAGRSDEIVETGAEFHVDVLRAQSKRIGQNSLALGFRSLKFAALCLRAARQDHRGSPAGERRGDVRIAHMVEPQLDEIRSGDRVAALPQLGRCGRRDGDAQKWR